MLLSQHAIAGAAIAEGTGSPVLGFFGGLVCHYLADCLPHIDNNILHTHGESEGFGVDDYLVIVIDFVITAGILLVAYEKGSALTLLGFGALGGSLPDIIDNVPFWRGRVAASSYGKVVYWIHNRYHFQPSGRYWVVWAIIFQVLVTGAGIWILW